MYIHSGQLADAMLAEAKFAWTPGPHYLPVIDVAGGRYLVCAGTGDAKQAFERARDLNTRIHKAIRQVCDGFQAEFGQPNITNP